MDWLRDAIRIDPSHAAAQANLAFVNNYLNRPEEALPAVELALRLSPHDPRRFLWLPALAGSNYLAGRYKAALRAGQEALAANPSYLPVVRYVIASLGQLGHMEGARTAMPLLRRLDGDLAATEAHLRDYFVTPAVAHIVDGLPRAPR
jgi:adenylate cyclase